MFQYTEKWSCYCIIFNLEHTSFGVCESVSPCLFLSYANILRATRLCQVVEEKFCRRPPYHFQSNATLNIEKTLGRNFGKYDELFLTLQKELASGTPSVGFVSLIKRSKNFAVGACPQTNP